MARWLSWLERRPVTAEVMGPSPIRVVNKSGVLAQLGEHLPYKQRVTGSSPVGPIFYLSGSFMPECCTDQFCYQPLRVRKFRSAGVFRRGSGAFPTG